MTDFRALCSELVDAWDDLPWQCDWKGNPVGPLAEVDDGPFDRARAALAAPDTNTQLFEEAIACGLITHIRLAAACHPDKIKLEEVCSPANAALIVFARNVLARWSK
jgi:hypothetical protein